MGSIQGHDCVLRHKVCPIGHEATEAASEDIFVLLVDAKKADYYVMPNVSTGALSRLINEEVKVVGYVDKQHKSIWVDAIYQGDKPVWGGKMRMEHYKK